jgi:hypothetical protein
MRSSMFLHRTGVMGSSMLLRCSRVRRGRGLRLRLWLSCVRFFRGVLALCWRLLFDWLLRQRGSSQRQ